MRKGEEFAKLSIGRVIKIVQSHFNPILKVSLEQRLPVFISAVNSQRLHFLGPFRSNATRYIQHSCDSGKGISFEAIVYVDERLSLGILLPFFDE
jgi:hypothetical protein